MSQTISNIRPRILLTINRKSTGSIDELRIICQGSLYTHYCRASPLLQLGFLVLSRIVSDSRFPILCYTRAPGYMVDPQAGAVSRIRRRIFVRRKSAEKVRLAEYAICCQLAKFSSRKIGRKYVIRSLGAS